MSYTLLLDTSDRYLSVGILQDDSFIYKTSFESWQRQSEYLIPKIDESLKETGLELNQISLIVVGQGPGSYTGVRIALTVAKVIGCIANIPVKTVSSLAILGNVNMNFIAVMNARSKRSYIAIYEKGKAILKDCVLANEEVIKLIKEYQEKGFVLRGESEYLGLTSGGFDVLEGLKSFKDIVQTCDPLTLKPVYLKDAI